MTRFHCKRCKVTIANVKLWPVTCPCGIRWREDGTVIDGSGRIRGLGDVVAAVTAKMGIRPCRGCKKRQEWLNRKVPFRR